MAAICDDPDATLRTALFTLPTTSRSFRTISFCAFSRSPISSLPLISAVLRRSPCEICDASATDFFSPLDSPLMIQATM